VGFVALPDAARAELLADCLGQTAGAASALLAPWALSLLEFSLEGYFGDPRHGGNRDRIVWRAYGLDAALSGAHADHTPLAPAEAPAGIDGERAAARTWDVIVVGSGAGGAALVWRLAARGVAVLVLEKGRHIDGDAWHDEIAVTRRNLFVPYVKDEPHVVVAPGRAPERRHDGWTACCVGGGTVHMSAMLLRMPPRDFGGRDGDAAWPIDYAALQPYYDLVETTLGVSGDRGANPFEPPGPPFPLPPIATHPAATRLTAAARALGVHPYPTPRGILSRPYRGRAACVYCPFCGGYACEAGAKAGADVTFLRLAEATGSAIVATGMRVTAVRVAGRRAEGVDVIDASGVRRRLRAARVVLAAGAVESARLALLSDGLGNRRDQVGRHLTGSYNAGLAGRFAYEGELFTRRDDTQPFLNLALQDLLSGPNAVPGVGTVVVDRRPISPIDHALTVAMRAVERGAPLLGAALKDRLFLELAQSRAVVVESFQPMRPHPERRVTLDDRIADAWQLPAARITLARQAGDEQVGAQVVELGDRMLRSAGAADTGDEITCEETPFLMSGTMRMGTDPATSVVDPNGRVHGLDNVYVCDAGALPGMGGVPPTLTIMANAIRIADGMVPA
jgi:choline dehydrogenase-like flavoprotein